MIKNCIDFDTVFNQYYIPKFRKYNIFGEEENDETMPYDDNYYKIKSLSNQLLIRRVFFNKC